MLRALLADPEVRKAGFVVARCSRVIGAAGCCSSINSVVYEFLHVLLLSPAADGCKGSCTIRVRAIDRILRSTERFRVRQVTIEHRHRAQQGTRARSNHNDSKSQPTDGRSASARRLRRWKSLSPCVRGRALALDLCSKANSYQVALHRHPLRCYECHRPLVVSAPGVSVSSISC